MKGSDRNKLIIVVVLFVLAAVVFAWQMGYIGGAASSAPNTPPASSDPGTPIEEQPGSHRSAPGH